MKKYLSTPGFFVDSLPDISNTEYRIQELGTNAILWCKVKGWFNNDLASKGFFNIFSAVNKIMTKRQLRKIKSLSEMKKIS